MLIQEGVGVESTYIGRHGGHVPGRRYLRSATLLLRTTKRLDIQNIFPPFTCSHQASIFSCDCRAMAL